MKTLQKWMGLVPQELGKLLCENCLSYVPKTKRHGQTSKRHGQTPLKIILNHQQKSSDPAYFFFARNLPRKKIT